MENPFRAPEGEVVREENLYVDVRHSKSNQALLLDPRGNYQFPICPVTGEKTDRIYKIRMNGVTFKHWVSEGGARRLRTEHLVNQFAQISMGSIPVIYFFLVLNKDTFWQTTTLPLWAHPLIILVIIIITARIISKNLANYLTITPSRVKKPRGFIRLKYRQEAYPRAIYKYYQKHRDRPSEDL